jgi:glucose-1-phosphate thymidylyltransferase
MQAVILAAGEGIRMRPLTFVRPKPLIEVTGAPILEHVVRALPDEIDEIILVVKYMQEKIRDYCGSEFLGRRVTYVEQGALKGTAGALSYARPYLSGRFLVTFADDLLAKKDLEKMMGYEHALLAAEHEHPERFGVLSLNEDGTLRAITEKPAHPESNLISTGVAVLTQKIFDYDPDGKNGELFLTGMLTALATEAPVRVVKTDFWQPIGYPDDIARAEASLEAFTKS